MTRQPAIIESSVSSTHLVEQKPIWERQEGEPLFWFNRYKRFQGLGPKRTMLQAVEQERRASKAPKSSEKPKPARVPGSWKQASIKYRWVERAQRYDEDKVEKMVAIVFEDLYDGVPMAFNRVMTLKNIHITMTNDFNKNQAYLSPEQRIAYYARMTAILRDIREEMRSFDHATQLLLVKHFMQKEYENSKSPTTPEGYAQLVEKAGSVEALSLALEKEDARRKERKMLEQMIDSAFAEEKQ